MIRLAVRLVAVLVFAGWFLVLRPQSLGGPASWILVAGDSMEPAIPPGTLVVVLRRAEYAIGDVVAYPVPAGNPGAGANVIHRIVGGSPEAGFVVRGDNTNAPDIWRPGPSEIVGSAWLIVPDGALPLLLLRSPIVVASFAAALATYVVLGLLAAPRPSPQPATSPGPPAPRTWRPAPRIGRPRGPGVPNRLLRR